MRFVDEFIATTRWLLADGVGRDVRHVLQEKIGLDPHAGGPPTREFDEEA